MKHLRIDFVSDITAQPIIRELKKITRCELEFLQNDINQHFQKLHTQTSADIVVLNTRAEFFLKGGSSAEVENYVDEYVNLVDIFSLRNKALVALNTVVHNQQHYVGLHQLQSLLLVGEINRRLIDLSLRNKRIIIVDVAGALHNAGLNASVSIQNDMVMKMPYRHAAIVKIAQAYDQAISQHYLPRKKVLVLDADNTLWGGVVGEDGIHGVQVDEIFPGAVYWEFQKQLLRLRESGMLLALVSKNNESDVVEMFDKISMPLKLEHFITTRINWNQKSKNIESIAQELNVGLDALVFIDDNQFEINEVQHSMPMVDGYRFDGKFPDVALTILATCRGLSTWSVTDEDLRKSEQYEEESQRKSHLASTASLEEYLLTLDIEIKVGINRFDQIPRISQLTNKTNQFNLTSNRYSELDVEEFMKIGKVYDFRVIDKFGDMGVVGVVILNEDTIDTFLMSCRALGREVENSMLKFVCNENNRLNITAKYKKTKKNIMVENFFERNGFELKSTKGGTKFYIFAGGPKPKYDIKIERM